MGGILMGFKGSRGPLVIIVIIALVVIAGLAVASQGPPKSKVKESDTITVTIQKHVGIDTVTYENIDNPGEIKVLTIIDLPYSFNCTRGDTLIFTETTRSGYNWNTWDFSPMTRSIHDNPLQIDSSDPLYCEDNRIIVLPSCSYQRVMATPTPSPSPFITASPIE
jgi:hypothetical protein